MFRIPKSWRALVALMSAILVISAMSVGAAMAQPPEDRGKPDDVRTASDRGKGKLHPRLRDQVEAGSMDRLRVYATVLGDPAAAAQYLDDSHVGAAGEAALIVGTIPAHLLPKLASVDTVVSVGPIDLEQSGEPLGIPDPELDQLPSTDSLRSLVNQLRKGEVPYDEAPPPHGSNFEELKDLDLLDANTHDFTEAWADGFTGNGTTIGVLDGGTDFGHPDLLNTWQVWTDAPDPGWNGWPKAFDPFGTLLFLSAPDFVELGMSWYTPTQEKACPGGNRRGAGSCRIKFDTRLGPSRNFGAPDATRQHTYRFPAAWSQSGTVHVGNHPDDHLLALYGERPVFITVDPNEAGVYDTVYVDLDNDRRFDDEKPVTKDSPASYRDMNGDGYTDLSGGLLYYISDGETEVPGGIDLFGGIGAPGPGELLAWTGDYDPAIGGHGTATASNIVGQGVVNGLAPTFDDVAGGTYPGAVIGGAPDAKLAPFGDIYFSFDFSTQFGYLLSILNGVDITSNSYGSSDVDNDGYDAASQEADIWHTIVGQRTTPLFSTGNGAPGFGTAAPPAPYSGISVGASTQFGGTGWDSIANASQITDDDVMVWSNRGPGATGANGVDVVADGAFSAGDVTLNAVLDGRFAWNTWGGTSRSTPVAVGATALIYEAWRDTNGPIPAGFNFIAKDILKSSAEDLGYESWIQGAGSVDAGRAVRAATGAGASVSPSEWRPGDYRGEEWEVFTHLIAPGESDTQTFTVEGDGDFDVSDRQMVRTNSESFGFTSVPVAQESPYNFNAPDYLFDVTSIVEANADADLMVVRMNFPYAQHDPDGDYQMNQEWRLLTYDWTDIDGDGNLWSDADADTNVDKTILGTSSSIDGFADIDYASSEIDEGEYVRFIYHRAGANTLQSFVRDPADRMADGLFIGLQHPQRADAIPQTSFEFQIDFYTNVDWDWITTPATASGSFDAMINVPDGTPYGMYGGAIVLEGADGSMVVPVSVTVGATVTADEDGNLSSVGFGGADVAEAQDDLLYNNGSVFGANDWTWRPESGDWRFFYYDVLPDEVPEGTSFLADTTWDGTAPHTDLDTLIFGRSSNDYQLSGQLGLADPLGVPYVLDTVGGSPNTNVGGGVWTFDTATGGAREIITAPAQSGLHAALQHQVGFEGDDFHVPFETTIGTVSVDPAEVTIDSATDAGTFEITFNSTVDLDGLTAEGFGLSQPDLFPHTAQQDDPNDPSSASVKLDVTIEHASTAHFSTDLETDDIDLFVVYDANGDGQFTNDEIVAASATGTSQESIELVRPADGDYQVWVQGWAVAGSPAFNLLVDIVQGNDLSINGLPDGAVAAGTSVTLMVDFDAAMTVGETYFGELLMGPPAAPGALRVPVAITRTD